MNPFSVQKMRSFVVILLLSSSVAQTLVSVELPYEAFSLERFLGVPFAQPAERFTEGKPIDESKFPNGSIFNAFSLGKACPQLQKPENVEMSEDCLNLDVSRPPHTNSSSQLPVMVWIYGGGFLSGSSSGFNPVFAINYTHRIGLPFIHVALNYRINGFGFLGGKEAAKAGVLNLGLKDQRLALKWVQKYISYFGGDPNKVTIYGESAGGISVCHHLTAYGGSKETNLFRAAIAESGSPMSLVVPNFDYFQTSYDFVVDRTGCQSSNDTLGCLKALPYDTIAPIIFGTPAPSAAPGILRTAFAPTIDGDLIPDVPFRLVKLGRFVKVPFISGENLDEGTGFINYLNWTNTAMLREQVSLTYPNMTSDSVDKILSFYPNTSSEGSPYNTGNRSYYGPVGKQAASLYGDLAFVASRRFLIDRSSAFAPTWCYRFDFDYKPGDIDTPSYLGVAHGYEIFAVYLYINNTVGTTMTAYWASFATNLDPNFPGLPTWDRFNSSSLAQIRFEQTQIVMRKDDYRRNASDFVNSIPEQLYGFTAP